MILLYDSLHFLQDLNIQRKYDQYLETGTSPDEAYKSLEDLFREDFLQTGDQLLENQQNNLTVATQINGFLQMMALDISKIVSYFALLLEDKDIDYYSAEANATLRTLKQQVELGAISQADYQKEVAKWQKQETKAQEEYNETGHFSLDTLLSLLDMEPKYLQYLIDENGQVEGAEVFHAGTKLEHGKFLTNGGRVLGVTGKGATLDEALEKAYNAVKKISFENVHYRTDIGKTK